MSNIIVKVTRMEIWNLQICGLVLRLLLVHVFADYTHLKLVA